MSEKIDWGNEDIKRMNKVQYKIKDNFFSLLFNTIDKDFEATPVNTRLIKPYLNEVVNMLYALSNNHLILREKIKDDLYDIDTSTWNTETIDKEIIGCMTKMIYWIEILQPKTYEKTTNILKENIKMLTTGNHVYFAKFLKIYYYHVIDVIHHANTNQEIYSTSHP
jgi:hypothetical protein